MPLWCRIFMDSHVPLSPQRAPEAKLHDSEEEKIRSRSPKETGSLTPWSATINGDKKNIYIYEYNDISE